MVDLHVLGSREWLVLDPKIVEKSSSVRSGAFSYEPARQASSDWAPRSSVVAIAAHCRRECSRSPDGAIGGRVACLPAADVEIGAHPAAPPCDLVGVLCVVAFVRRGVRPRPPDARASRPRGWNAGNVRVQRLRLSASSAYRSSRGERGFVGSRFISGHRFLDGSHMAPRPDGVRLRRRRRSSRPSN